MSTYVVSCGGTGGHLSPGIALAEGLRDRGHDAVLLISRKQVDARLSEKYPALRFERIPGSGFSWKPLPFLRCVWSQAQAVRCCLRLFRRERPVAAVGFGGFTSAPLVLAACLRRVPAALHESNRVPGLAVRTLGRFARRVYLPPGVRHPGIRSSATRHVGLPVRREIVRLPRAQARAALGFSPERPLLLVLGGSQGAGPLNDWARDRLDALSAAGIQVCVVTGMGKGREGPVELPARDGPPVRSLFLPFSDRMAEMLSAADLVVSRAGAGTLAELVRCETPAILVPYPQAADDHQRVNADYHREQGGGLVVPQDRLGELLPAVLALLGDDAQLRAFRTALQRLDRADALALLLDDLDSVVRSGSLRSAPPSARFAA